MYYFDPFTIDINECDISNGGCEQTCTNEYGNFEMYK